MLTRAVCAGALLCLAFVVTAQAGCESRARIISSSMEPTIHCARPHPGCQGLRDDQVEEVPDSTLERGDIISFMAPQRAKNICGVRGPALYVKRLIGLPGERWLIRHGFVYINGRRLREPYVRPTRRDDLSFIERRIPSSRYVVLGDNRPVSCDSRAWGNLPAENVVGHVVAIRRGARTIKLG
jgi:signal peptidase I